MPSYVYRPAPHPVQRPKIAPLIQGVQITADARLITYSPLAGLTSVARVSDSRLDFRSIESGQSSVSRPTESRWFFESQERGNSSVSKPSESRITFSSAQTGNSSVSKIVQAALAFRSYLSALGSITVQVFADARLFFGSLFKGDATVTALAESNPAFEVKHLTLDLDDGHRSFKLKWGSWLELDWGARTFRIIDLDMTKTGVRIDPVVIGDDFTVPRTYTGLPTGIEIDTAWFTVKDSLADPDLDALIQKVITPTESPAGHIVVANTSGGFLEMFFDPTRVETMNAIEGTDYFYDIQVRTTSSKIHTLERGNISFITGVTSAST